MFTPHEREKLLLSVAAMVARDRQRRGVKLNYPEATAVIATQIMEWAREGRPLTDVVEQGATTRRMYFPAGTWFNVWTGESVQGEQWTTVDAPIGSPPVYSLGEDREDIRGWEGLGYDDCR